MVTLKDPIYWLSLKTVRITSFTLKEFVQKEMNRVIFQGIPCNLSETFYRFNTANKMSPYRDVPTVGNLKHENWIAHYRD